MRSRESCERLLRERFRVDGFRPGQWEAVQTLLRGRDLMALFPTGAGKSVCYQLPALLLDGPTLVISPLIALMRDQTEHLRALGIPAVCLDSLQTPDAFRESLGQVETGAARLIYVSPERLQSERFRRALRAHPPALAAVDEAHCVIEWGKAFRPAYAQIGRFLRSLEKRPPVCAMTATADRRTQRAIRRQLGMRRTRAVTLPLVRENLVYRVQTTLNPDGEALALLRAHPGERGLIFCRTRARCEALAAALRGQGAAADFYHAGREREERDRVQASFAAGAVQVLACTSAFGMGVDIPGIRFVLHDRLPESLTALAQQSGRAGRDGKPAECVILLDPRDLQWIVLSRMKKEREARKTSPLHPLLRLRRLRECREETRAAQAVLDACLGGECLPRAIVRAFGQDAPRCEKCSACLRSNASLVWSPSLRDSRPEDITRWALSWQRDVWAERLETAPDSILPGNELEQAVRTGRIPAGCEPAARRSLQALAEHLAR